MNVTPRRGVAAALLFSFTTGTTVPAWAYTSPSPGPGTVSPPGVDLIPPPSCLVGPTPSTCASQAWVTACSGFYDPDACMSLNEDTATSWQEDNFGLDPAATEAVFNPRDNTFAESLPPLTIGLPDTLSQQTGGAWAAQEEKAKFEASKAQILNPLWYTRPLSWVSGVPLDSCETYVYRAFYSVERWLDALNACKTDDRCKVKVSLHGMTADGPATTPGIARRVMVDNEGEPISERLSDMRVQGKISSGEAEPFSAAYTLTVIPKNSFYADSHLLIVPSLIEQFKAQTGVDLQLLHNELWRGSTLYDVTSSAQVTGGKTFIGADGKAHRGFKDEWEWHSFMLKRTEDVTAGQFREYRRRSDRFLQGWDVLADKMKCMHQLLGGGCNVKAYNALGKVHPGDTQMWQGDPIASRAILASIPAADFLFPPSQKGMIGFGDRLQDTGLTVDQIVAGIESGEILSSSSLVASLPGLVDPKIVLGGEIAAPLAPSPGEDPEALAEERSVVRENARNGNARGLGSLIVPLGPSVYDDAPYHDPMEDQGVMTAGGVLNHMWELNPALIDNSGPWPRLLCIRGLGLPGGGAGDSRTGDASIGFNLGLVEDTIMNTHTIWREACQLTNQVIDEWGRRNTGKPSCLDGYNMACDWQPKDFVDRFVTRHVGYGSAAKEAEYRYCKRWTAGGQVQHPDAAIGVDQDARKTLPTFRGALNLREAQFNKKLKSVPVQGQDDFGTTKGEDQEIGNSDFGGGYSYTLSWHAKGYERYQNEQDPTDARNGNICRMGGNAVAKFDARATLFGNDLTIVDALGSAASNDGDTGLAQGNTHLYVIGYKVFDTKDADGADADGNINLTLNGAYDEPLAFDGGKPMLFAVPFQVGWVTLTVKAGIAYGYGVRAKFDVGAPAPPDCDPDNPLFKADAMFAPFADLGLWVSADVSLAGIIGVGVEVELTLVGIELPLQAKVWLGMAEDQLSVNFQCTLDLVLTTLAGELSFYIEAFWTKVASFTILKWDGFKYKFPIFKTPKVSLPIMTLTPGSIAPPGGTVCSDSTCS
jgi:hypothetical protein